MHGRLLRGPAGVIPQHAVETGDLLCVTTYRQDRPYSLSRLHRFLDWAATLKLRLMVGPHEVAAAGPPPAMDEFLDLMVGDVSLEPTKIKVDREIKAPPTPEPTYIPPLETLRAREMVYESAPIWMKALAGARDDLSRAGALHSLQALSDFQMRLEWNLSQLARTMAIEVEEETLVAETAAAIHADVIRWLHGIGTARLPFVPRGHISPLLAGAIEAYAGAVWDRLQSIHPKGRQPRDVRKRGPVVLAGESLGMLDPDFYGDAILLVPEHLIYRAGAYPLLALAIAEHWSFKHRTDDRSGVLAIAGLAFDVVGPSLYSALRRFGHPINPGEEQRVLRYLEKRLEASLESPPPVVRRIDAARSRIKASLEAGQLIEEDPIAMVAVLMEAASSREPQPYVNEPALIGSMLLPQSRTKATGKQEH